MVNSNSSFRQSTASHSIVGTLSTVMLILAVLATTLQVAILPIGVNIICAVMALAGTVALAFGLLRPAVVMEYPVSSFSIWGLYVVGLWAPLVFTTLEWNPITYELQVPVQTFGWSLATCLTLTAAHAFYRSSGLGHFSTRRLSSFWARHSLFDRPHDLVFWSMGLIGFVCQLYLSVFHQQDFQSESVQGIGGRIINGIAAFTYTPFVLVSLPYLQPGRIRNSYITWLCCSLYMISLLGLAILSNARGFFAVPLLTIGLAFLLVGFIGKLRLNGNAKVLVALTIPVGLLVLSQLADLATAMRIARVNRGNISAVEMMKDTLEIFGDKHYIAKYSEDLSSARDSVWEENYVSSVFLSRFVMVKFLDITLAVIPSIEADGIDQLRIMTIDKTVALLPSFVYNKMDMSNPKDYVNSFSMGDYIYYLGAGDYQGIGSFKVGSMISNGVAIIGYGFIPLLFVMALPIFVLFDSLSRVGTAFAVPRLEQASMTPSLMSAGQSGPLLLAISPIALIFIQQYFGYWAQESLGGLVVNLVRGIFQQIVFYWIFVKIGKLIFGR